MAAKKREKGTEGEDELNQSEANSTPVTEAICRSYEAGVIKS